MSTSKKRFFLANPFDARSLARLFEQITGKRVSEAEIADAQKRLDQASDDSTAPGEGAPPAPSTSRKCRRHHAAGNRTRLH
jgi:hypothetical protein